jgi:hypothetical protein
VGSWTGKTGRTVKGFDVLQICDKDSRLKFE